MLTMHSQSVNVDRLKLIEALKNGLALHQTEYEESRKDYEKAVLGSLEKMLLRAKNGDFSDVDLKIKPPVDHSIDYQDMIEMLEVSVDATINLDRDSYKAYYKNEWSWSKQFKVASAMIKGML